MSVKLMTTDQIQTDLATIFNMWGGGIPPEQTDRVNALRAELKRRGTSEQAQPQQQPKQELTIGIEGMTDDQLAAQLASLSQRIGKDPSNENLQEQFANVRFEMRKRVTKAKTEEQKPVTGNFDPNTGETHMQQFTNGNGHGERLVPRQVAPDPEQLAAAEAQKAAFIAAQAERVKLMEAAVRKHNLAKTAADVAARMLEKYGDPTGDDVENVCTIALHVAETIFAKVGL